LRTFGRVTGSSRERDEMGNVILLGVCVLLLAYLVAALLWPEKF